MSQTERERDVVPGHDDQLETPLTPKCAETGSERRSPVGAMATMPALVRAAKASIRDPGPAEREILARLEAALHRSQEGRLRVAMLGQFKRGKSTLLNALLGVPLLPTGITPITAIPTYVQAGKSPSLRIEFEVGRAPLESHDPTRFPNILAQYCRRLASVAA